MISLEQIQLLEQKVESAVAKILQLTEERDTLHQRCVQLEEENKRLQSTISDFHQDQDRIEQGIIKALDKLNAVENSVLQAVTIQHQVEEVPGPVVQDSPIPVEVKQIQQDFNNVVDETYNHVPSQTEQPTIPASNDDLGLIPMFSEEVVKEEFFPAEEATVPDVSPQDLALQPEVDSLFVENQDIHHPEQQLDIF